MNHLPPHADISMAGSIDVRYEPPRSVDDHTASVAILAPSHDGLVVSTMRTPDDVEEVARRLMAAAAQWRYDRGDLLPGSEPIIVDQEPYDPPTVQELPVVALGASTRAVLAAPTITVASA